MIKTISRLSSTEIAELKKGVVQVSGKAMNRTALGTVAAIFEIYPSITFAELKEMLPDSINPSAPKNYKSLFAPYTERPYGVVQPGSIRSECQAQGLDVSASHFVDNGETFKTSDGVEVLVSRSWESADTVTKEHDLQNLINHVAQYGIRVVQVEKQEAFNRGHYHLEILNPALVQRLNAPAKKSSLLIPLVGAAIVGCGVAAWYFNRPPMPAPAIATEIAKPVEIAAPPAAPLTPIEDLKADIAAGENTEKRSISFHNILFKFDSDEILPQSDSILTEALELMTEVPALKIEIVGHTSNEGNEKHNEKLSVKRAEAVKKYLTQKGIESSRMKTKGLGSSNPMAENTSEDGKSLNRRIEFVVTDDGVKNESIK